ncbi:glycosyltransferase family 2 protein [Mucilaginibacter sp.]|jgi:glycosyltransferase involved in cell wall biosynthesis|uniref:glycosyltransferase family 2 protein n=1 Tax=Mucilaginibacter sp. TaxID=1882438 RepID=UPI003564E08A
MKIQTPQVSICIPTYNNTYYLKKTLSSIISQIFTDYELIITDDSDNQDVKELIDQFNFQDKLRYYHNEKPLGSPRNWNCCISKAQGKYIKIMHHDDWFSSTDALENLVGLIKEHPNNILAFCGSKNIALNGSIISQHSITDSYVSAIRYDPEFIFYNNVIGAPSVTLFKKNDLLFDENLKYVVDIDYYIRLLKLNPQFAFTKDFLINIGLSNTQVTESAIHNKNLLIFEYSHTYQKLKHTKNQLQFYFDTFWMLIRRFNIKTNNELTEAGWSGAVPYFVTCCIKANGLISYLPKKHYLQQLIKNLTFWQAKINDSYKASRRVR